MRIGSPALFVSASVTLRNQFVFFCVVICRGLWNAPTLHTAAVERLCAERSAAIRRSSESRN